MGLRFPWPYVRLTGASVYYGPNSNIISREALVTPFHGGHRGTRTSAALTRLDLPSPRPPPPEPAALVHPSSSLLAAAV